MLQPRQYGPTSKTRMDVTCWIKRIKLASSSGDEGQLTAKPTARSNAGHKMTTTQHQPAGMQLLECIAVQPWTQQVTKETIATAL